MRRPAARLSAFARARDGVTAIEFALTAPALIFVILAGVQVIQYINALRKVEEIATTVSSMISQANPPSPAVDTATVSATDLNFSYDSTLVIFPYVMFDAKMKGVSWRKDITVSYASIKFTQLTPLCKGLADQSACYVAQVIWTSTGTSTNSYRPCLVPQTPIDDGAPTSRYSLPRSVFGDGTLIAVDVSFRFVPTFGSGLVAPVVITRSAFVQPRYAKEIDFDATGSDGIATTCT